MEVLDKISLSNKNYYSQIYSNNNQQFASTTNGTLFSCFMEGTDDEYYKIKILRSNDNGLTWNDTKFPVITDSDHRNPSMVIDTSNMIHVVFSCPTVKGGSYKIYYVYSNNGGETWSNPESLQSLNGYNQNFPQITFDRKNNRLNVVWSGTDQNNGKAQIKFCTSTDKGKSWSQYKNVATIATYDQTQPRLKVDSSGSIYVFWSGIDDSSKNQPQIKFTKSIDFGASWLSWSNIYSNEYAQYNYDVCINDNDDLAMVWYQKFSESSKYQIAMSKSINGGAVWSNPTTATEAIDFDQCNPRVLYNDGSYYIFWSANNDTTINKRLKLCRTEDCVTFTTESYVTSEFDTVDAFSLFKYNDYILIMFQTYNAVYFKKYGYRKYLFQDGNNIFYSKYELGNKITEEVPTTTDSKTYLLKNEIKNNTLNIYQLNKPIDASLYTPNYSTGDIVFKATRTGDIKFVYTAIEDGSTEIADSTSVVTVESSDRKTYKIGKQIKSGTLKAYENNRILVDKASYSINNLYGKITFNNQINFDINVDYVPVLRTWEKIGTIPVTLEMFDQYGHEEITWVTYDRMCQLTSSQPYILFMDKGIEYTKPTAILKGDSLSKYRYKVTMDGRNAPLKNWSDYIINAVNDKVLVKSSYLPDSEPKNINVTVEQNDDGKIITRSGTVALHNEAPKILAQVNGTRLDINIIDPNNDRICYNIYVNGKRVYPVGTEYTDYLTSPSKLSYIFKAEEINIDEDNVIVINAKDEYNKTSKVRLNFVGEYTGLIFMDSQGHRYSGSHGLPINLLDMGLIQAGSESAIYEIYLKNLNGFNVKNISIWGDGIIDNGKVVFSKTLSPFVDEDKLMYSDVLLNEDKIVFYIKVKSNESILPGGGDFRVVARGQSTESVDNVQQPLPDPNNAVTFKVIDENSKPLYNALVCFNNNTLIKTDVEGKAVFDNVPIKNGIEYTIAYNEYENSTGSIDVVGGDPLEKVIKMDRIQTHIVKFTTTENDSPISNVNIVVKGQTFEIGNTEITYKDKKLSTDYDGTAEFNLVPGTYQCIIKMNGYITLNKEVVVSDDDQDVGVEMRKAKMLTFVITDGSNPIEYANVNIGDKNYTADYYGKVTIGVDSGEHNYTISADRYEDISGSVTVENDDVIENVTLVLKSIK